MKICFCSSLYLDEEEMVKKTSSQLNISAHKLIKNIIKGLEDNLDKPCHLINIPEVPSFPRYKQIIFYKRYWRHCPGYGKDIELGFLNLVGLKYMIQTVRLVLNLRRWIKSQNDKELVICSYGRRFSHVMAINFVKLCYPCITTCMILGDLSGKYAGDITVQQEKSLRAFIVNKLLDFQVKKSKDFDCFVLITEYMAQALNLTKPYCVIEGIGKVTGKNAKSEYQNAKKIIVYAGGLEVQYNILGLLDAFELITSEEYELWLFGHGSAVKQIELHMEKNSRIHYFGVVSSREIAEAYSQATVLVNPRKNEGLYTRYTFPSKTMEYLASGKPVIGYKLDGIPKEYEKYMFFVDGDTSEDLKKRIVEICEKTPEDREMAGKNGKDFIACEKSPKEQCKKMVNMFIEHNRKVGI